MYGAKEKIGSNKPAVGFPECKQKSALRKGWELLLQEFHKCLLPAVPTAHYCDSWNLEPCPFPTRMWSSWQETVVELHPKRSWAPPRLQPPHPSAGASIPCDVEHLNMAADQHFLTRSSGEWFWGGTCPLPTSWPMGVCAERAEDWCWLTASIHPFLEHFPSLSPPHCAKCWKRQLQYYCSEAHLLTALDGLALISIAVETGASRVTSLGISYRVGFLHQLCYLLYTL